MPFTSIDMTGQRVGRLLVLHRSPRRGREARWLCRCDCGEQVERLGSSLRRRMTLSCGCIGREASTRHGKTGAPTYWVYRSMLARCSNPRVDRYPLYGGRGIAVCERWQGPDGFANFLADMGERPDDPPGWTARSAYWSIDRIDPDGNYEPGNCRWASPGEQRANQRPPEQPTHCRQGHEYTPWNTYVNKRGHRYCRTCRSRRDSEKSIAAAAR